jgi:hypothetical protein
MLRLHSLRQQKAGLSAQQTSVHSAAKVSFPPFLLQTPSMLRCAPMS